MKLRSSLFLAYLVQVCFLSPALGFGVVDADGCAERFPSLAPTESHYYQSDMYLGCGHPSLKAEEIKSFVGRYVATDTVECSSFPKEIAVEFKGFHAIFYPGFRTAEIVYSSEFRISGDGVPVIVIPRGINGGYRDISPAYQTFKSPSGAQEIFSVSAVYDSNIFGRSLTLRSKSCTGSFLSLIGCPLSVAKDVLEITFGQDDLTLTVHQARVDATFDQMLQLDQGRCHYAKK